MFNRYWLDFRISEQHCVCHVDSKIATEICEYILAAQAPFEKLSDNVRLSYNLTLPKF